MSRARHVGRGGLLLESHCQRRPESAAGDWFLGKVSAGSEEPERANQVRVGGLFPGHLATGLDLAVQSAGELLGIVVAGGADDQIAPAADRALFRPPPRRAPPACG